MVIYGPPEDTRLRPGPRPVRITVHHRRDERADVPWRDQRQRGGFYRGCVTPGCRYSEK